MPVPVDSHNKIDDDISSLDTHTLQHKKVEVPVTKLEMSGAVTDAKVAAVPYAKGPADKKNAVTQDKKTVTFYDQTHKRKYRLNYSSGTYSSNSKSKSSPNKKKKTPKHCRQINEYDDPCEDKDYVKKENKFSSVDYKLSKNYLNFTLIQK